MPYQVRFHFQNVSGPKPCQPHLLRWRSHFAVCRERFSWAFFMVWVTMLKQSSDQAPLGGLKTDVEKRDSTDCLACWVLTASCKMFLSARASQRGAQSGQNSDPLFLRLFYHRINYMEDNPMCNFFVQVQTETLRHRDVLASILASRSLVSAVCEAGCYLASTVRTEKFKDWAVVKVRASFIFPVRSATQSLSSGLFDNWRDWSWHKFLTVSFYSTESSEAYFSF